jgi:hypothetical protein
VLHVYIPLGKKARQLHRGTPATGEGLMHGLRPSELIRLAPLRVRSAGPVRAHTPFRSKDPLDIERPSETVRPLGLDDVGREGCTRPQDGPVEIYEL